MVASSFGEQLQQVHKLGELLADSNKTHEQSVMVLGSTITDFGLDITTQIPGYIELAQRHQDDTAPNNPHDPFFKRAFSLGALATICMSPTDSPNHAQARATALNFLIDGAVVQGAWRADTVKIARRTLTDCIKRNKNAVIQYQEIRRLGGFGNLWTNLVDTARREKVIWTSGGDLRSRVS